MVLLYFYTWRCLHNLHSRTTDLSINMFHLFLSPHPWISVNARMEKCSPRQAPLSSVCSDFRAQPLALPNVCKQNLYRATIQFCFNIPFRSQTFLLFIVSLQTKAAISIVCADLSGPAQPPWLSPALPKTFSRAAGCQQELTFAASSQVPEGQQLAVSLFANWKSTSFFPECSINRNSQAKGWGNPSPSPVGSFPLCPADPGSGFYPGTNYLERKSCCNPWS